MFDLALTLGLAVALCGALLLALGTQLQSAAVFQSEGRWRRFLTSPRWYAGTLVLGIAVCTNFVALALAPVSVVQSVSIIALAVSAVFGVATRQVRLGGRGAAGVLLSMTGITGFILIVTSAKLGDAPAPSTSLSVVTTLLAAASLVALLAFLLRTVIPGRATRLFGLLTATIVFGSITTVFKALVTLVLTHGFESLATSASLIALGLVASGGTLAIIMLQSSHKLFPAPVVVAAITIVDPLTAALIGINALHEADLPLPAASAAAFTGCIAIIGVITLSGARRIASLAPHPPSRAAADAAAGTAAPGSARTH